MAQLKKQPGQLSPEDMQMAGGQVMGGARPRGPATMPAKPGMGGPMPPGPAQPGPFQPMAQPSPMNLATPQMENYGPGLGDGMGMVKDVRLKQPGLSGPTPLPGQMQGIGAMGKGQGAVMGGGGGQGMPDDVLARLMAMFQGRGQTPGGFGG